MLKRPFQSSMRVANGFFHLCKQIVECYSTSTMRRCLDEQLFSETMITQQDSAVPVRENPITSQAFIHLQPCT